MVLVNGRHLPTTPLQDKRNDIQLNEVEPKPP